ncbi:unnamed protein product, partial [Symbiodinium sp. KB8]
AMVVPPEVTTAVELRIVLLKFLFLERGEQADGLGGDLPPVALLRARSLEEIDVSEMRAVANLLEMPEAELRSVADHVKSQQALPASLRAKASPAALRRLLVLLDAWHEELSAPAPAKPRFAAVAAYRRQAATLVASARRMLKAEEELAAATGGAPLAL